MVPARCSLVTLGVDDVARSKAFYRALGWEAGIDMDDFAVLRTARPAHRAVPARRHVPRRRRRGAGGPRPSDPPGDQRRVSPRRSTHAVAEFVAAGGALLRAPAEAEWGGYTSIVADPDGHAWEIAHNPGWPLGADGLPQLP